MTETAQPPADDLSGEDNQIQPKCGCQRIELAPGVIQKVLCPLHQLLKAKKDAREIRRIYHRVEERSAYQLRKTDIPKTEQEVETSQRESAGGEEKSSLGRIRDDGLDRVVQVVQKDATEESQEQGLSEGVRDAYGRELVPTGSEVGQSSSAGDAQRKESSFIRAQMKLGKKLKLDKSKLTIGLKRCEAVEENGTNCPDLLEGVSIRESTLLDGRKAYLCRRHRYLLNLELNRRRRKKGRYTAIISGQKPPN